MRLLKTMILPVILIGFIACKTEKTEPEKKIISALSFESFEYVGEHDFFTGEYQLVLSVDYDEVEVTKAASEFNKTKDVIYMTIYGNVNHDAQRLTIEPGQYYVSPDSKPFRVLAGKKKLGDKEFEGSYVVSTIDGVEHESRIVSGIVDIELVDGKYSYSLSLTDEFGYLAEYEDMRLKYEGKAEEAISTEIEYEVFDRQRCYYWGPPIGNYSKPEKEEELVGEYLYELSNEKYYVSFYITEDYEYYGLDANIKTQMYYVNQTSFFGVKGTIFKYDLSKPDVNRSGTASITATIDDVETKHYVEDGWLAVLPDGEGNPNRLIVTFILQDGTVFRGRFDTTEDTKMHLGDEWTLSDIRENINIDNLTGAYMRIMDPGFRYKEAGTNHWELFLTANGAGTYIDEYGYVAITGPGDCFRFEISTNAATVDALPARTYKVQNSYWSWVAQQGNKDIGWIGIYSGAWFHHLTTSGHKSSVCHSGEVKISIEEGVYTIETTLYDDAKNTIKGKYVGTPTIEDHRTPAEPENAPAPMRSNIFKAKIDKNGSTEYKANCVERINYANSLIKLK